MKHTDSQPPLIPVILSGGAGTRLWPVSRRAHPKPFMELVDGETLAEKTLLRAKAVADNAPVITVTSRDYYFYIRDLYAGIKSKLLVTSGGEKAVQQFEDDPVTKADDFKSALTEALSEDPAFAAKLSKALEQRGKIKSGSHEKILLQYAKTVSRNITATRVAGDSNAKSR